MMVVHVQWRRRRGSRARGVATEHGRITTPGRPHTISQHSATASTPAPPTPPPSVPARLHWHQPHVGEPGPPAPRYCDKGPRHGPLLLRLRLRHPQGPRESPPHLPRQVISKPEIAATVHPVGFFEKLSASCPRCRGAVQQALPHFSFQLSQCAWPQRAAAQQAMGPYRMCRRWPSPRRRRTGSVSPFPTRGAPSREGCASSSSEPLSSRSVGFSRAPSEGSCSLHVASFSAQAHHGTRISSVCTREVQFQLRRRFAGTRRSPARLTRTRTRSARMTRRTPRRRTRTEAGPRDFCASRPRQHSPSLPSLFVMGPATLKSQFRLFLRPPRGPPSCHSPLGDPLSGPPVGPGPLGMGSSDPRWRWLRPKWGHKSRLRHGCPSWGPRAAASWANGHAWGGRSTLRATLGGVVLLQLRSVQGARGPRSRGPFLARGAFGRSWSPHSWRPTSTWPLPLHGPLAWLG